MTNDQNNISKLIFLHLKGELTEYQKSELDIWLQDEHNYSTFMRIVDKVTILNKTIRYDNIDSKVAWEDLLDKIPQEKEVQKRQGRHIAMKWMAYAAGIMLPIIFAILLWPESDKVERVAENEQIISGGSEAILYKADGEVINLKSDTSKIISIAEGAYAHKKEGKLIYEEEKIAAKDLFYNTIKTPVGGEFELVLADGTHVWLNADSYIKFPTSFSSSQRKVFVGGEVFFDVTKNKKKPFVVNVEGMNIKVLGTQFNVRSYKEEKNITTTLVEGKVEITNQLKEKMLLSPGNQILLNRNSNQMLRRKANIEESISWKNGRFLFDNRSLESIMMDLSRWYDVEVFYYSSDVREERFSIDIEKYDTIDKILHLIEKTGDVKFNIKGRVIYIK